MTKPEEEIVTWHPDPLTLQKVRSVKGVAYILVGVIVVSTLSTVYLRSGTKPAPALAQTVVAQAVEKLPAPAPVVEEKGPPVKEAAPPPMPAPAPPNPLTFKLITLEQELLGKRIEDVEAKIAALAKRSPGEARVAAMQRIPVSKNDNCGPQPAAAVAEPPAPPREAAPVRPRVRVAAVQQQRTYRRVSHYQPRRRYYQPQYAW